MSVKPYQPFEATGGAQIGMVSTSWPFAKLTVKSGSLRITVRLLGGDYHFTPDTVIAITRHTMIPILGWGILIQHCQAKYPARIIFRCLGNPDTLLANIRESGFTPRAPAPDIPESRGFALRWQTMVIAIAIWNGLFILDLFLHRERFPIGGPFTLISLGLVIVASIAAIRIPAFQQLILKPGRSVGEILPFLNLLLIVVSFLFAGFAIMTLCR